MAKVNIKLLSGILVFILLCFFQGCSNRNEFNESRQDLVFFYNRWVSVNIKTKIVEVKYGNLHYVDTISIQPKAKELIFSSFKRNRLNEFQGEHFYYDNHRLPSNDFEVRIYEGGKLRSTLLIDYDFKNEKSKTLVKGNEIMKFKNEVLSVLDNVPEVKKARQQFDIWYTDDMDSSRRSLAK